MQLRQKFAYSSIVLTIVFSLFVTGCGSESGKTDAPQTNIDAKIEKSKKKNDDTSNVRVAPSVGESPLATRGGAFSEEPTNPKVVELHPVVLVKTSLGDIKIKLDVENAPATVDNFLTNYVERGFYSQSIFHYIDKGTFVAAGGYTSNLKAKPTAEEIVNEAYNGLKNIRGTVAMVRHPKYAKSATSQFLINLADNSSLLDHRANSLEENYNENFGYCVFGEVIEGMDVVDKIAAVKVSTQGDFPNVPVQPITIQSIKRIK